MDAQLIEQLDQKRYKYLTWQTIGFAMFFPGVFIEAWTFDERVVRIVLALLTGLGAGLFLAATVKSRRNERQIKSDTTLREALNNELIRLYGYKSLMCAFYATLITAGVLYFVSEWWLDITARVACLVIVYAACLSLQIARLIYLRK